MRLAVLCTRCACPRACGTAASHAAPEMAAILLQSIRLMLCSTCMHVREHDKAVAANMLLLLSRQSNCRPWHEAAEFVQQSVGKASCGGGAGVHGDTTCVYACWGCMEWLQRAHISGFFPAEPSAGPAVKAAVKFTPATAVTSHFKLTPTVVQLGREEA